MNAKLVSVLLTISFFTFLVSGCSDKVTNPGNQTKRVNGKVTNVNGIPITGVTVSIESKTAITTSDGAFSIDDITEPFDVKLLRTDGGVSYGDEFIGLRNFSPVLIHNSNPNDFLSSTIQLSLPAALGPNQKAALIFTDGENVFTATEIQSTQSGTTLISNWKGPSTVNGKIYILIYTSFGGNVTTYDNYGEIDFTINAGSVQTKNVTQAEISTNPIESNVSGVVNAPSGYSTVSTILTLKFGKGILTSINLGSNNFSAGFGYSVPTGLSNNLKLAVIASATGPLGQNSTGVFEVQPGSSGVNLNLNSASELNTPINSSIGIDTNNIFTYTPVAGGGVYRISFSSGSRNFVVYTQGTSTRIPNFLPFGVNLGFNISYSWNVTLMNTSIDNLVHTRFDNNPNVTQFNISNTWFFTTN